MNWKIFTKSGRPGWACIVPIYNLVVLMRIVDKPGWWWVLYILPIVNVVVAVVVTIALAKSFGKDGAYAAGLILLPLIFFPILAFGKSTYQGIAR